LHKSTDLRAATIRAGGAMLGRWRDFRYFAWFRVRLSRRRNASQRHHCDHCRTDKFHHLITLSEQTGPILAAVCTKPAASANIRHANP
jgi:hypothetical protein